MKNYLINGEPWQVAAARAAFAACIVGGLAFLAVWSQTTDLRVLTIAGLTPALTTLATRLGIEGAVDSRKK